MVQLPVYTYDGASDYKDHAQLLKLMQHLLNFKKKGVTSQNVVSNGYVNDKDIGTGAGFSSQVLGGDWLGHLADQVLSVLKDKIDLKGFQSSKLVNEPYDGKRDKNYGGGTNSSYIEPVVEFASADPTFTADPYASTSNKGADSLNVSNPELDGIDKLGNINEKGGAYDDGETLYDDDNISEGEGFPLLFYLENVPMS
nr:hypothetical protein [Tanacetum cinerariifolium]